jgi:hypothetical protein
MVNWRHTRLELASLIFHTSSDVTFELLLVVTFALELQGLLWRRNVELGEDYE